MSTRQRRGGVPSAFPPRPSRRVTIALATIGLLTLLYSLIIAGQILLWFILAGGAIGLYLVWLLILAVFRLVEAVERIATAAEVDSGIRDSSETGPEAQSRRSTDETPADDAPDGSRAAPDPDTDDRRDDAPAAGDSDDDLPGGGSDGDSAPEDRPDHD